MQVPICVPNSFIRSLLKFDDELPRCPFHSSQSHTRSIFYGRYALASFVSRLTCIVNLDYVSTTLVFHRLEAPSILLQVFTGFPIRFWRFRILHHRLSSITSYLCYKMGSGISPQCPFRSFVRSLTCAAANFSDRPKYGLFSVKTCARQILRWKYHRTGPHAEDFRFAAPQGLRKQIRYTHVRTLMQDFYFLLTCEFFIIYMPHYGKL